MADVIEFATRRPLSDPPLSLQDDRSTSDVEGRLRALEIDQSWIVEAPAGSGKTGLLIQRYLALLASPNVHAPEQILAITFTRAATEEIRERILEQLVAAKNGSEAMGDFEQRSRTLALTALQRDQELGWQLLEEPGRLRIQTIDALCSEIVHSLPANENNIASLQPTELAEPLYRQAAQRTLLRLGEDQTPAQALLSRAIRDLLLHRDGDLHSCEALIADMLRHREQWSELVPFSSDTLDDATLDATTLPRLNAGLRRTIRDTLQQCLNSVPDFTLERLAGLAAELAHAEAHPSQKIHPLQTCRDLVGPPAIEPDFLDAWKGMLRLLVRNDGGWRASFAANTLGVICSREQRDSLKDLVSLLCADPDLPTRIRTCLKLPAAVYPASDWAFVKALFRVLHAAVADLTLVFEERSACDFTEFSIHARLALERAQETGLPPDATSSLRHLLVDEMQDTSSRQYDLLERLTSSWDGHTRTVFLVGDPKQSIYLFRQARVERFIASMTTRRLGTIPLNLLRLTSNFRSQAAFIEKANEAFARIFSATAPGSEVTYTASVPSRPASVLPDTSFVWNVRQMPAGDAEQRTALRELREADARAIRTLLESWIARALPADREHPWRIAVLVRNRKSLGPLLPVLRGHNPLPFRAVEIEALGERREVLDLLALTRALLHPGDRIAWLAVLRAPWCGLTLADLHQLTGADTPALRSHTVLSLAAERLHTLSEDGQTRLSQVAQVLRHAIDVAGDLRLPELVERTWRALRGDLILDEVDLANARAFLRLLRTLDRDDGYLDPVSLQNRVDDLRAVPSPAPAQVDLVTIHGAKGLEWDFVIVPELDRSPPSSRSELLLWEELASGDGLLLAPVQGKGEKPSPLQTWLLYVQATRAHAEHRRLLYVAATRAREELHLFGAAQTGKDSPRPRANSLLEAAWPAAQDHLTPAPAPESRELSLAASATDEEPQRRPTSPLLERVPEVVPADGLKLPQPLLDSTSFTSALSATQSPVLVRAMGTVVHALIEYSANRIATGTPLPELARNLSPGWQPRVRALLLAQGVNPADLPRGVDRVLHAVERTLTSPIGQWILTRHPESRNELALTEWGGEARRSRVDRIFRAGDRPLDEGLSQRWIIDYKTSTPGHTALAEFFGNEQARYRGQLERYAATLRKAGEKEITLGLWFPLLAKLVWWPAPRPDSLALSAWHVAG